MLWRSLTKPITRRKRITGEHERTCEAIRVPRPGSGSGVEIESRALYMVIVGDVECGI